MPPEYPMPERCLLAQAAIWVADRELPIPDELFIAGPKEPTREAAELIRALATSQIKARGALYRASEASAIQLSSLEIRPKQREWVLQSVEEEEERTIPAALWRSDRIVLARSRLVVDVLDAVNHMHLEDLGTTINGHHYRDHVRYIFDSVTVQTQELLKVFPPSGETPTSLPQRARSGRRPQYEWDQFFAELVVRADLDGLPQTQAKCIKDMAKWCREHCDEEPADSVLKEKISLIYNHHRKAGR